MFATSRTISFTACTSCNNHQNWCVICEKQHATVFKLITHTFQPLLEIGISLCVPNFIVRFFCCVPYVPNFLVSFWGAQENCNFQFVTITQENDQTHWKVSFSLSVFKQIIMKLTKPTQKLIKCTVNCSTWNYSFCND